MALVADSSPITAMDALEARLRNEAQDREQRLRAEFKAQLKAGLTVERERRLTAEHTARDLAAELRKLKGTHSEDEDSECFDTESDDRCSPLLMEEQALMAAPPADKDEKARQSTKQMLLTEGGVYKSLEVMNVTKLEGMEFEHKDLPMNMWGVAIMTMTRDIAEVYAGGANICYHLTRSSYIFLCVGMNLGLQLAILRWVNMYVVGESVWTIQGNYASFHNDIFDAEGRFSREKWVNWDGPRDDLCGAVLTNGLFLGCILFLWIGRMLGEFKSCQRLFHDINALPSVPAEAGIKDTILTRNESCEIIGMTWCTRFFMYLLVVIPQTCICLLLGVIGCQWLTATESFADLILNALALEFIIGIDEQILEFFLPKRAAHTLETTKFAYPSGAKLTETQELEAMVHDYYRNIFYFIICIIFTAVYLQYFQQVLPGYENDIATHCGAWYSDRFFPKCSYFEKGCFPFGDVKEPHDYSAEVPS